MSVCLFVSFSLSFPPSPSLSLSLSLSLFAPFCLSRRNQQSLDLPFTSPLLCSPSMQWHQRTAEQNRAPASPSFPASTLLLNNPTEGQVKGKSEEEKKQSERGTRGAWRTVIKLASVLLFNQTPAIKLINTLFPVRGTRRLSTPRYCSSSSSSSSSPSSSSFNPPSLSS